VRGRPSVARPPMSALYVFAITREAPAGFEFDGHLIEFIAVNGAVAAIERKASRRTVSEAALRIQHQIVLQIAARVDEILPVRFGASVDEQELEQLLTLRRSAVQGALDLVRGRVQMTIRLRDQELREHVADGRHAVAATGTAYLEARRAAAVRPPPADANAATEAVRHVVVSERHDSTRLPAWSMYHLIERARVRDYLDALSSVELASMTVSGPWPPFAFAPDLWP
jgi:hypothetical protein